MTSMFVNMVKYIFLSQIINEMMCDEKCMGYSCTPCLPGYVVRVYPGAKLE